MKAEPQLLLEKVQESIKAGKALVSSGFNDIAARKQVRLASKSIQSAAKPSGSRYADNEFWERITRIGPQMSLA